jgi:beta-1,4-mannooligosaccharide/beta-1,4-mannosyl-N-acetylglucosamine phosphorylase
VARCGLHLLSPQTDCERVGDVPNLVFPGAALVDARTGSVATWYGAADAVTGLAFAKIDELLDPVRSTSAA